MDSSNNTFSNCTPLKFGHAAPLLDTPSRRQDSTLLEWLSAL